MPDLPDDEYDVEDPADQAQRGRAAAAATSQVPPPPPAPARTSQSAPAPRDAAPEKPRHPRFLVDMALDLGLSRAQIDAADTDDLAFEVRLRHARQLGAAEAVQQRPQLNAPPPPPAPEPPDPLDFNADDYEPGTGKLLGTMRDEIKALRQHRKESEERERTRQTQSLYEALDAAFEQIGDARYGKGDGGDLDPAGREMGLRKRLIAAAGLNQSMSLKQVTRAVVAAHREFFGESPAAAPPAPERDAGAYGASANGNGNGHAAAPAAEKPRDPKTGRYLSAEDAEEADIRRWQQAGVERPTHREPATQPRGKERANGVMREKLTALGLPTDNPALSKDDAEAEDTLLD